MQQQDLVTRAGKEHQTKIPPTKQQARHRQEQPRAIHQQQEPLLKLRKEHQLTALMALAPPPKKLHQAGEHPHTAPAPTPEKKVLHPDTRLPPAKLHPAAKPRVPPPQPHILRQEDLHPPIQPRKLALVATRQSMPTRPDKSPPAGLQPGLRPRPRRPQPKTRQRTTVPFPENPHRAQAGPLARHPSRRLLLRRQRVPTPLIPMNRKIRLRLRLEVCNFSVLRKHRVGAGSC